VEFLLELRWKYRTGGFAGTTNLGRITFTTSSDAHLKKDIQYVATPDNALAEVLQWKPAHFK
jgi:hypothetical protein